MKPLFFVCLTAILLVQSNGRPVHAEGFFDELKDNVTRDLGRAIDTVRGKLNQPSNNQYQGGNPNQSVPTENRLTRSEIIRLQEGLNALGYNVGVADGIPGSATQRGIERFLQDQGRTDLAYEPSIDLLAAIEMVAGGSSPGLSKQANNQTGSVLATQQVGSSAIGVDPALGVPVLHDRPAVIGQVTGFELVGRDMGRAWKDTQERWQIAWQNLQNHLLLGQDSSILDDEDMVLGYASAFLSDAEKRELFGPDYSASSPYRFKPDEFERRQIKDRFRAEYAPRLISSAPKLPFSLVEVRDVYLQEYDFDKQLFPISYKGFSDELATKLQAINITGQPPIRRQDLITSPPAHSPILSVRATPAEAEGLVSSLKPVGSTERKAYLGIFSTITAIIPEHRTPKTNARLKQATIYKFNLETRIDQVGLYADPGLTQLITSFDLNQHVTKQTAGDPLLAEVQAIQPTSALALFPAIAKLTGQSDFVSRAIQQGYIYQRANEFDREQVLTDELQRVKDSVTETLWLHGELQLGEYDHAREVFPIVKHTVKAGSGGSNEYGSTTKLSLYQPDQLSEIAVQPDRARNVIEQIQDRKFRFLAQATPVNATINEGSKLRAELQVSLGLTYVVKPIGKEIVVLAKFVPDASPAAMEQSVTATFSAEMSNVDAAATPDMQQFSRESFATSFPADIVGLHLDMSFDEADRIIKQHMTVGEMLEARRQPLPDSKLVVAYSSGRLYIRDDGMEFIQVLDEPPAAPNKVAAVIRWMHMPKGTLGPDTAHAALTDKYGAPNHLEGGAKPYFIWGNSVDNRSCDPGRANKKAIDWYALSKSSSITLPKEVNLRKLPSIGLQSMRNEGACGPAIAAKLESGKTDSLAVWLADQSAYAGVLSESRRRVDGGELASGGDAPTRPTNLKM